MENFWQQFRTTSTHIIALAPMDGVSDQPFRFITQKYGGPDVIYTEFVNVEGLCHNAERLLKPLLYDQTQRPIVAQIYGKTPASFRQAAILVSQLGFDGVDLNMGCPSKSVAGGGAGAALISNPELALEIISATKQGLKDWANGATCSDCEDLKPQFCQTVKQRRLDLGLTPASELKTRHQLPLSIKTRTGFEEPSIETWIPTLLSTQPAALALHGRTLRQSYRGLANWDLIARAAQLTREHSPDTLFLGNGDVINRADGIEKARECKLDGVLIGRAAQGNPFVFSSKRPLLALPDLDRAKKLASVALEHAQVYEQTFQDQEPYSFLPMRKHLAWYINSVAGAKQIRQQLVRSNSSDEVREILKNSGLLD